MYTGDVTAAGTGEPGHAFFLGAELHTQETGNDGIHIRGVYGALARLQFTLHQLLCKRPATGRSAGATVGVGEHVLDLVDARIFVNKQSFVGDCQNRREQQSQQGHEGDCDCYAGE